MSLILSEAVLHQRPEGLHRRGLVRSFHAEHKEKVDMLFVDPPPASVPASFMLRQGDFAFANFLNSSLDYLESNGVLDVLDTKYEVSALRERKQWR